MSADRRDPLLPNEDDARDPRVEAAWRELPDAEPPAALDDALRAAARRAVNARPQVRKARSSWPAWLVPLAAAACVGVIAIGVVEMRPQDSMVAPASVSDMPAVPSAARVAANAPGAGSAALKGPPAPSAPAESSTPPEAAGGATADRKVMAARVPEPFPAAPVPAPAPAPAPLVAPAPPSARAPAVAPAQRADGKLDALSERAADKPSTNATVAAQVGAAGASAPGAPAAPPAFASPAPPAASAARDSAMREEVAAPARSRSNDAASATDAVAAPSAAPAPPIALAKEAARTYDDYIASIRRALGDKRDDDAVKELQALRGAYPDADERMPVDLRSWAFRVRK